jgi:hypothetical protein
MNDKNMDTLSYLSFYYYFVNDYEKAWEFDLLASLNKGFSIPLFETVDEYILRYKDNTFFKMLLDKYKVTVN